MNTKKIIARCVIAYLAFAIISLVTVSLIIEPLLTKSFSKSEARSLYKDAVSFTDSYALLYYSGSLEAARLRTTMRIYALYTKSDMWLMDADGTVNCAVNSSQHRIPRIFNADVTLDYFNEEYSKTGNFYDYYEEDYISVCVPVSIKYETCGYLIINKPVSALSGSIKGCIGIIYSVVFIVLGFAFIMLTISLIFFLRPINAMLSAAKEYSSGNFKPQIPLHTIDELNYLINTFNFMSTKLDTHEDDQRKFISNVSHDFRSPLTSIRGYLQAMLDGTIPPELHEKYLKRILDEADRLTGLTNSLLDLNRIGSRDFTLDISDFDINDIIIASSESSEVQAKQKNVGIKLILCGEVMKVHADKGKIQQVLYNLLDNAIKFSKENTTITIETKVHNSSKLYVSVSDQGVGIPKESLDKLFNRFYKADQSRGQNKKGTGLGLSIVKEIIQAHDEKITVTSTVDVGTTFTFSLQLAEEELENY